MAVAGHEALLAIRTVAEGLRCPETSQDPGAWSTSRIPAHLSVRLAGCSQPTVVPSSLLV